MAARKKAAPAKGAAKIIVAFVLSDVIEGEGEGAKVVLKEGQRMNLPVAEFKKLSKEGIVAEGKFVKMLTGIEGKRYSLKPRDKTWISPKVFPAWEKAGYCVLSDEDPGVVDALRDREAELTAARARCADLETSVQEAALSMSAARDQAMKVRGMIEPDADSDNVLDDKGQALLSEVIALVGMFPEEDDPEQGDPQLNLA